MAILDKTRKFLWAKSGNRCAICRTELITSINNSEDFNVGEECHIISSRTTGPRHIPNLENYDNFENLILLCKNHHKQIDDLKDTYTEEILRYIKSNHENWVRTTINDAVDNRAKIDKPRFLAQIRSGKELFNIINGVYGYYTDYDDVLDEKEADYIGGFFQTLIEYGDITGMSEAIDKVSIGYELQKLVEDLNHNGYFIFADRGLEPIFEENPTGNKWTVATIIVRRKENQEILKIDLNEILKT